MLSLTKQASLPTLRKRGGFFHATNLSLVEVYGQDAASYLHAQTTNDVLSLPELTGQKTCVLDRKAHVQLVFNLYRRHQSFRIIINSAYTSKLIEHFEMFKFSAKAEFLDFTKKGQFFSIQGPLALKAISQGFKTPPQAEQLFCSVIDAHLFEVETHLFKFSSTGEIGYLIWIPKKSYEEVSSKLIAVCKSLDMEEITDEVVAFARVESGLPEFGVDFQIGTFLPETGIETDTTSATKGCYPGQEVIARVRGQGAPARGTVGLVFDEPELTSAQRSALVMDAPIKIKEQDVGNLKTTMFCPSLGATAALAVVKREFRLPGKRLDVSIGDQKFAATIKDLPIYTPPKTHELARALYDQALQEFAREDASQIESGTTKSPAVSLLQEALDLDPLMEDCYEALGVILSKQGQLEQAIKLMRQLAEINPDSVMAHANLSVFYVEKGLKEEAEEEKAISMSIRMRLAAKEAMKQKEDSDKLQERRKDAESRMGMFKQVIEIDADDLLANTGLGQCLVVLQSFEEAEKYLRKAIEVKRTHTVAYESLAECLQGLGRKSEAIQVLNDGIKVASERGDMQPLKKMQVMLDQLGES